MRLTSNSITPHSLHLPLETAGSLMACIQIKESFKMKNQIKVPLNMIRAAGTYEKSTIFGDGGECVRSVCTCTFDAEH